MSENDALREQRELKRRLENSRRRRNQEVNTPDAGNRNELVGQSVERRQELEAQIARGHWTRWSLPSAGLCIIVLVALASLATIWHLRDWRKGAGPAVDGARHRPVAVVAADLEATPAGLYAKELLFKCRQSGMDALQDRWAAGLPNHLREISAKSLAPFLAAPGLPVRIAAVEQRPGSVFVRVVVGDAIRLTLHLREPEPGRFTLIAVE